MTIGCISIEIMSAADCERFAGVAKAALGVPDCADRPWRVFEAGERGTMFQTMWAEPGRKSEPDTAAHLVGMYECHSSEIEPLPDAGPGVSERKGGASLEIVTDGPQRVRMPNARVSAISSPELKFRNSGLFWAL